jgi:hypothetical protein
MSHKQKILELQVAILSNEALMSNIYKRALGKPELVGQEVSQLALSILNYTLSDNKYSNPYNIKDYSNPYSL